MTLYREADMRHEPKTLLELVDLGIEKNTTDVVAATKREGKWHKTHIEEYKEKVRHFALGLYELGVRPGDKVALHAESCTEWLIVDQAILSIGAINVPIYTTQPGDQIKFILENSESKAYIFTQDKLFASVKPCIKKIKDVKAVIAILPTEHEKVKSFEDVLAIGQEKEKSAPELFESLRSKIEPDDLATLIYTSGTTGMPKGVMLTHHNISSNVVRIIAHAPFDIEGDRGNRVLSYLPLSHVLERMVTYMYHYIGYPVYFIEDINEFVNDLKDVKPIFFVTIPRLLEKVHDSVKARALDMSGFRRTIFFWAIHLAENYDLESPPSGWTYIKHKIADKLVYSKIREVFGGNLVGIISGGAALSPMIMRFFNALGVYCGQGYGLTETSPVLAVSDPKYLRAGSAGKVIDDVELKIDEDGEILAKGPNVMQGYFKQPEATEEAFTDGWFHTGDIGKIDEDEFLFITDRKKALFKLSTGKYVAPQPIENAFIESPFIEQAMVIGNQHKFCSALIVPSYENIRVRFSKFGHPLPEGDLSHNTDVISLIQQEVDKYNRHFSHWEQVKKFALLTDLFTIDTGELTPTMKMKRSFIKEKFKKEIDAIYENE